MKKTEVYHIYEDGSMVEAKDHKWLKRHIKKSKKPKKNGKKKKRH